LKAGKSNSRGGAEKGVPGAREKHAGAAFLRGKKMKGNLSERNLASKKSTNKKQKINTKKKTTKNKLKTFRKKKRQTPSGRLKQEQRKGTA